MDTSVMNVNNILSVISGVSWTIVYIVIIYRGFKDKASGMPLVALGLNFSWEFIYSFVFPVQNKVQLVINIIWCLFDVVIIYQKFRFGRDEYNANLKGLGEKLYYPSLITTFIFCFFIVYFAKIEWNDFIGLYSAFIMNLIMSVTFIPMLLKRGNLNGQSFYIAFFKLIGTLAPTILFTFFHKGMYMVTAKVPDTLAANSAMALGGGHFPLLAGSHIMVWHPLVFILGIGCFFFDTVYLALVCREYYKLGYNIFTRKVREENLPLTGVSQEN